MQLSMRSARALQGGEGASKVVMKGSHELARTWDIYRKRGLPGDIKGGQLGSEVGDTRGGQIGGPQVP